MKTNHSHPTRALQLLTAAVAAAALALGPALAANPYAKPDDSWISISGTVDDVRMGSFTLDYKGGMITVEMDDGDRDADAYKLAKGDKVTVNGVIDDDLFETKSIEASSVYVENLDTYFYASAVDEEDTFVTYWSPVVVSKVVLQGTVTDVDEEEFTMLDGTRAIRVEVEEMPYNPLDDEGYQKIKVGDRVSVTGMMDQDLFEGRELVAESVTTLSS